MKKDLKKWEQEEKLLSEVGIKYTRTRLGEAVFVHKGARGVIPMLFPSEWSIAELRAIADYMEQNPRCSLFSDGSGSLCK